MFNCGESDLELVEQRTTKFDATEPATNQSIRVKMNNVTKNNGIQKEKPSI